MKLVIRTHPSTLGPRATTEVRRRIFGGLARVSPWVRAVELTIVLDPDANAFCRLQITGRSIRVVTVEDRGQGMPACVDVVVMRAARQIAHQLSHRRLLTPVAAFRA